MYICVCVVVTYPLDLVILVAVLSVNCVHIPLSWSGGYLTHTQSHPHESTSLELVLQQEKMKVRSEV